MHEHNECEHKNLKYCKKCDVVYCEDCKREWGNTTWTYTSSYPIPCDITYTDIPFSSYYGGNNYYSVNGHLRYLNGYNNKETTR